jgi:hypothetical protein
VYATEETPKKQDQERTQRLECGAMPKLIEAPAIVAADGRDEQT